MTICSLSRYGSSDLSNYAVFSTGQETVISAEAIALELTGEARYVEEFSGGGVDPSRMGLRLAEKRKE